MKLTKPQLKALYKKWKLAHSYAAQHNEPTDVPRSFLAFRRSVRPTFGMDNAIVVDWTNITLVIETDGHIHSQKGVVMKTKKIEENRKGMTPIQKLVDDLYWDYDRMSSSGQKTLDKLFDKVFKLEKNNEK